MQPNLAGTFSNVSEKSYIGRRHTPKGVCLLVVYGDRLTQIEECLPSGIMGAASKFFFNSK